MLKKIWHDPVFSKIISNIITWVGGSIFVGLVGLSGFVVIYLNDWWSKIFEFLQKSILWVFSFSKVPNWCYLS